MKKIQSAFAVLMLIALMLSSGSAPGTAPPQNTEQYNFKSDVPQHIATPVVIEITISNDMIITGTDVAVCYYDVGESAIIPDRIILPSINRHNTKTLQAQTTYKNWRYARSGLRRRC